MSNKYENRSIQDLYLYPKLRNTLYELADHLDMEVGDFISQILSEAQPGLDAMLKQVRVLAKARDKALRDS